MCTRQDMCSSLQAVGWIVSCDGCKCKEQVVSSRAAAAFDHQKMFLRYLIRYQA